MSALLLLLGVAYALAPFPRLDAAALNGLETLNGPVPYSLSNWIAHAADPLPLAAMLCVVVLVGLAVGRWRQALAAALAVGAANLATQILKVALAHPRYHGTLPHQIEPAAFPSGHATAAMSIALAAVIVSPSRWRGLVAPFACTYPAAVSISILILGWHFPSDVLGGLLVAAAFAFGAVAILRFVVGGEVTSPRLLRLSPAPVAVGLAALAFAGVYALARAGELASFAAAYTAAVAVALGTLLASAALTASASLLADP